MWGLFCVEKDDKKQRKKGKGSWYTTCIGFNGEKWGVNGGRKMYYVYRFLDSRGVIIYVGRTRTKISTRMGQHFGRNGHLSVECYGLVYQIDYLEIESKIEMYIKELYYIDKWKPEYNEINKYEEESGMVIESEDKWVQYKGEKDIRIMILTTGIRELEKEIEELNSRAESKRECESLLVEVRSKKKELRKQIGLQNKRIRNSRLGVVGEAGEYNLKRIRIMLKKFREVVFYGTVVLGGKVEVEYTVYRHKNNVRVTVRRSSIEDDYLLRDLLGGNSVKLRGNFEDVRWFTRLDEVCGFSIKESVDTGRAIAYEKDYTETKNYEEARESSKRERVQESFGALTEEDKEAYNKLYWEVISLGLEGFEDYYSDTVQGGETLLCVCKRYAEENKHLIG